MLFLGVIHFDPLRPSNHEPFTVIEVSDMKGVDTKTYYSGYAIIVQMDKRWIDVCTNEDIYSVRFDENRAYIVTFQRTDPLYLINLDNPEDPYIDGELEVPGFSDYLHPINDNYLIGVGNDADANGFAQGVKVTLFDVSNPSSPQELNSLVFGERGSSSAASYDLRAFASLTVDNDFRFTLPIRRNGLNWTWLDTGLYLFEVEGVNDSNASLSFNGSVISESSSASKSWPNYGEIDRGILHDDAVFYMHGEDLWTTFWHSPAAVKGPY